MAKSIAARIYGDDYQQLVFWKYALMMLNADKEIIGIAYEDDEIKSFDDIVITYSKPQNFRDEKIIKEYYQIKFHIRDEQLITLEKLMDPSFVNASKHSFLDKAVEAYRKFGDDYKQRVFILYTPYDIDQTDKLYGLISNIDSTFDLGILFDDTTDKSKMGKIRKEIRERLNVTQEELKTVLRQIRICSGKERMDELIETINQQLDKNGLQHISKGNYCIPYTQLVSKLFQAGIKQFDKTTIIEHLINENLFTEKRKSTWIAVRSYLSHAEKLDEEVESVLQLEDYFEDGVLKKEFEWGTTILTELKHFLDTKVSDSNCDYYIRFEANPTIAFMAGRILDIKSGKNIIPCQRTEKGILAWDNLESESNYSNAEIEFIEVDEQSDDVAVVVEFSREILNDVKEYMDEERLTVRRIINIKITPPSSSSVIDGRHAWLLANQIKNMIDGRKLKEKRAVLHLFIACPISIVFILSRYSLSFGKVQMYEYDLKKTNSCTYYPTVLFSGRRYNNGAKNG